MSYHVDLMVLAHNFAHSNGPEGERLTVELLAELLAVTRDHAEGTKAFAQPVVKAAESREPTPGPVRVRRIIEAYLLGTGWSWAQIALDSVGHWSHHDVGPNYTFLEALHMQFERDGIILSARGL